VRIVKTKKPAPLRFADLKLKEVWLNPSILNWDARIDSSSVNIRSEWIRAHELWLHAEGRLKNAGTHEDRADVIGVLRRVLNQRLKKLKAIYLDNFPLANKPSGTIERLAVLGIVKPLMLHRLLTIRNAIEYQDSRPPSTHYCAELLEFMWYFLRSTDILIHFVADGVVFTKFDRRGNETPYGFSITTGPNNKWRSEIHGWFEPKTISLAAKSDWLKVDIQTIHTKQEKYGRRKGIFSHEDKKGDDIWIIGKFSSEPYLEKMSNLYFTHAIS
jgi:hypothetical protein